MSTTYENVLTFRVPVLTPDGTCSASHELEKEPYDLRKTFRVTTIEQEQSLANKVEKLHELIVGIQSKIKADWFGIYQATTNTNGDRVLVKLAYQGEPSRAEFPLTQEFAKLSNNTTVALSGKAVVIQSVAQHEGSYYKCDGNVNSEACLPIFDKEGSTVVGIIDAEAFDEDHFSDEDIVALEEFCKALSDHLPLTIAN